MDTEEFLARVQQRTGLPDAAAALQAGRATITTLAEQLTGEETSYLARHLPPELARFLEDAGIEKQQGLTPERFFQRVSEREGVPVEKARDHARAVIGVLAETVPPDEPESEAPADEAFLSPGRPPKGRLH